MKKAKEPKDAIAFQIRNLALGLGLGLAASVGLAAGTFDGPFVHLGSNLANSQEDVSNLVGPGTTTFSAKARWVGQAGAGFSHAFGLFNLAASAYYVLGDQDAMEAGFSTSYGTNAANVKLKNTRGFSIEPGVHLNESTLIYLKLGYISATRTLYTSLSGSRDDSFHGNTVGLGAKYAFTPAIYGIAEAQQGQFRALTMDGVAVKPNSQTIFLGTGYKF